MRTITLIYDGTFNTYRWLKAMMWARNEFHDLGYKINMPAFLTMFLTLNLQKFLMRE